MGKVFDMVKSYRKSYPGGIAWRIKQHSDVIEKHLNPGEDVLFAFPGQKNIGPLEWFDTYVVAITSKRILLGHKNLLWGYMLSSVTPDMYNDLLVRQGILWGKITIDTVKEQIILSNLPKNGLDEIETQISEYMMQQKQLYKTREN